MISILRLNKDQIIKFHLNKDKPDTSEVKDIKYKLEFNTYFDNCFERSGNKTVQVNAFVNQLYDVIKDVAPKVKFYSQNEQIKIKKPTLRVPSGSNFLLKRPNRPFFGGARPWGEVPKTLAPKTAHFF